MASVSSTGSAFPMISNRVYKGSIDEDELDDEQFPLPPPPSSSIPSRHRFPSNSPSYENSREEFAEEPMHQYEDMNRLAAKVKLHGRQPSQRPRKKANEVYERVPHGNSYDRETSFRKHSRPHTNSGSSDSCESDSSRDRVQFWWRFIAVVALLLALVAVIISLLIFLGVVAPSCSCREEISAEKDTITAKSTSSSSQDVLQALNNLQENITTLHVIVGKRDETIIELKRSNEEQQKEIKKLLGRELVINAGDRKYNLSDLRGPPGIDGAKGPRGDIGLRGERGPQGPGNLTQCQYRVIKSTPFTADNQGSGSDVVLTEKPGKKILGVTCSTVGTSEYNLIYSRTPNKQYKCVCRGRSKYFPNGGPSDGGARCYLHYWICPATS